MPLFELLQNQASMNIILSDYYDSPNLKYINN